MKEKCKKVGKVEKVEKTSYHKNLFFYQNNNFSQKNTHLKTCCTKIEEKSQN